MYYPLDSLQHRGEIYTAVLFYNPVLAKGNDEIARLQAYSLSLKSKTIRVGLGTTAVDNTIEIGNTISQQGSEATGNYVCAAGSAFYVSITNAGIGFTPFTALDRSNKSDLVALVMNWNIETKTPLKDRA